MPVDWTQFSAVAPSSGVDWGQHSGVAPIIRAPKVKAVRQSSGGGNWLTNAIGDVEDLATGIPNALVDVGKATDGSAHQIWDPHYSGLTLSGGGASHGLVPAVAKGFVTQEKDLYGPLVHGDYSTFLKRWHEHPLGPVLDIATVLSLGGGAALRAARIGQLGDEAATVARTGRFLSDRELSVEMPQSRTLQGRLLQRQFDRWSMSEKMRDVPGIGGRSRLNRRVNTLSNRTRMARIQRAKLEFAKASKAATPEERFAAPIVAEGVKIPDLLNMYRKLQEEAPTRTRARYIKALEHPKLQAAIDEMSPALVNLVNLGHRYEDAAGRAAVEAGI